MQKAVVNNQGVLSQDVINKLTKEKTGSVRDIVQITVSGVTKEDILKAIKEQLGTDAKHITSSKKQTNNTSSFEPTGNVDYTIYQLLARHKGANLVLLTPGDSYIQLDFYII